MESEADMAFEIKPPEKYDLLASVHHWIFPDIQPVPEQTWDNRFGRVFTIQNSFCGLMLHQEKPGGIIRIESEGHQVSRKHIEQKMNRILGFSANTEQALASMKTDSTLSRISVFVGGIKPYSSDTPYEALIKTIIQQQISYRAANVITKRIIMRLSSSVSNLFQFPSHKEMLELGLEGMKELGLGYKSKYIHSICSLIEVGDLELDSLIGKPYEEIFETIQPIKGIGEWTVQVLAMAGLQNYSVFPSGDLGIQNILGRLYKKGKKFSKKEVIAFSDKFGDQGSMILYLLMSANAMGLVEASRQ
ncbi:MAG: DNA-3-methyladenine glycosylase family protein [Candidatus Thorarchaeota archaeon]